MNDSKLFVFPTDAASFEPMVDLLRAMLRQRLVESGSINFVVEGDDPVRGADVCTLAAEADADVITDLDDWILASRTGRFTLINVVTADSLVGAPRRTPGPLDQAEFDPPPPPPELTVAIRTEGIVRNAINSNPEQGRGSTLEVVNLVVPVARERSVPWDLWWRGEAAAGWRNVLAAPEVQGHPGGPTVLVESNEEYIAHVCVTVATVGGCWSGALWQPSFGEVTQGYVWTVVRSRSRSLIAPELPERILRRVGRATRETPVDPDGRLQFAIDPEPRRSTDVALHRLIERYGLSCRPHESVDYQAPRPIKVGIRGYVSLLWAWLTRRLPAIAGNIVVNRVAELRSRAEQWLNGLAGLDAESLIRISLDPNRDDEEATGAAGSLHEQDPIRRRWRWSRPEPALWHELRKNCFGMLDGGALSDDELLRFMTDGERRVVLGDPELISPVPGADIWAPSPQVQALPDKPAPARHVVDIAWADGWERFLLDRAAPTADPVDAPSGSSDAGASTPPADGTEPLDDDDVLVAVRADLERLRTARSHAHGSFLWGLGEHLAEQRKLAAQYLSDLEAQLTEARGVTPEELDEVREAGGKKRRKRLWIALAVLAALGVALVVGIPLLIGAVVSGAAFLVLGIAAGLLWFAGLFRTIWKWAYGQFLLEHRLEWMRKGRVQVLLEAIAFAETQQSRFENLERIEAQWSDLVAALCFFPFGSPRNQKSHRIRHSDLRLPASHQVAEGFTSDERMRSVVGAFVAELIRPGWLSEAYASAFNYAEQRFVGPEGARRRGATFLPDQDTSDMNGDRSALFYLVDAVRQGEARQVRELEIMGEIHQGLRDGVTLGVAATDRSAIVDFLFTPNFETGRRPSSFLVESDAGGANEEVTLNDTFFGTLRIMAMPPKPKSHVGSTNLDVEFTIPDAEALQLGFLPEFPPLVFSSWGLACVPEVHSSWVDLVLLDGGDVHEVHLELGAAQTLWQPPVEGDFGPIRTTPDELAGDWQLDRDHLPDPGELSVRPTGGLRPNMESGPFAFMSEVNGEPVTWPADDPIPFALRTDCAAPEALELVTKALQCAADRTGYTFEFVGAFDGLPTATRGRIEIGWARDPEFRAQEGADGSSDGTAIGFGGWSSAVLADGSVRIVGGSVLLNADMDLPVTFDAKPCHGTVLLHELGHALNLGHVPDPREVMNPFVSSELLGRELDFGPGDRLGLRAIAAASRT